MSRVQESGFAAAAAAAIGNAESYCLRWNTFNTFVAKGLGSLLEEDEFTDVTLASEGQFLRAHKMLLSMCSPFFKRLFKVRRIKFFNVVRELMTGFQCRQMKDIRMG